MKQFHLLLHVMNLTAFSVLALFPLPLLAQFLDCDGTRYRYTSSFDDFSVTYDVQYGSAINTTGLTQGLLVDIYEPEGDANENRPLIIMGHGGFFIGGDNDGGDVVPLCEDLAKMGYVVASMTYRVGIDNFFDVPNGLVRSVWRGYHDGKAAVRFFRKTIEEDNNPWGIHGDLIYLGGVSAGAFIGLHMVSIDEESEIPSQVDQTQAGMGGGLEGESGHPGYSSAIAGVVNIGGALKSVDYMSEGDAPIVSVHGTNDGTVPFSSGMIMLSGIPITEVDGSAVIHETAEALGIESCFTELVGAGHVPHITNADAYYQTLGTVSGALSSWICNGYEPFCGAYDYEAVGVAEWLQGQHGLWRAFPTALESGEALQIQWLKSPQTTWICEIYDASGRFIEAVSGRDEWFSVSTSNLSSGLHFIRIPGTSESHRFWIN